MAPGMDNYEDIHTPDSGSSKRKFGVRRRRFSAADGIIENARDGASDFERVKSSMTNGRGGHALDFNFHGETEGRDSHHSGNGTGKYMQQPHRIIKPGQSIMTSTSALALDDDEKKPVKQIAPPRVHDDFLRKLSSGRKPPSQRMRATSSAPALSKRPIAASSLERASAPTAAASSASSSASSSSRVTEAQNGSTLTRAEWVMPKKLTRIEEETTPPTSKRARVSLSSSSQSKTRPRPSLHGNGASASAVAEPTRASSRLLSRPSRPLYGMYDSDERTAPSNASASRRYSTSVLPSSNGSLSLTRRSNRTAPKAPTDGTEDMPIHLSDSEEDDDDEEEEKAKQAGESVEAAESEAVADDDLDMAAIHKDVVVDLADHRAWFGDRACLMDIFFCDQCLWLTKIKGTDRKWPLTRNYKVPFYKIRHALIYRPLPGLIVAPSSADPVERVMTTVSFVALQFPIPDIMNKSTWREFYNPALSTSTIDASDVNKQYLIVVSKNGGQDEPWLGMVEDVLRARKIDVELLDTSDEIRPFASAMVANDHHFAFTERPSPKKDETKRSSKRRRQTVGDNGDNDDADATQLTYPLPPCSVDIVTITRQDIARLQPREYLNDNIIDYYFKRLLLEDFAKNDLLKQNVLFLTSHFYSRLRAGRGTNLKERLQAGYKNVSTWLTRSDLFRRSLVFIPINKDTHWSMAVIVNPKCAGQATTDDDEDDDEDRRPQTCVALLDPLGGYHAKAPILRNLKSFLGLEWDRVSGRNESEDACAAYRQASVSLVSVKAPLQQNGYDCGVFILKYAQEMLTNFATMLQTQTDSGSDSGFVLPREVTDDALSALMPVDAFRGSDVTEKRKELEELLAQDTKMYEAILASR